MPTYNDCVHFMVCDRCPNCKPDDCEFFQNKADVAEVVRCKDCKYGEHYKCSVDACYNNMKCVRRENYTEGVFEDDYCSYGERKPPEDKP